MKNESNASKASKASKPSNESKSSNESKASHPNLEARAPVHQKPLHQKRYRKNEIVSSCSACSCERVLAYWDAELEHYIYLSDETKDEPVLCIRCQGFNNQCLTSPYSETSKVPILI